jgi:hypothetical protein
MDVADYTTLPVIFTTPIDGVVLAVAEFLNVLWNMDDTRVGDAIFLKVYLRDV